MSGIPWRSIAGDALSRVFLVAQAYCAVHVVDQHLFSLALLRGPSMLPAMNLAGDVVAVDRVSARLGRVEHGDVVLMVSPEDPRKSVAKRVVGMEGDSVTYLDEPGSSKTVVVPQGHVWVQGDNAYASRDSRQFGAVPSHNPPDQFERWVAPPPDPPPMSEEEKKVAQLRRLESPPRCKCGDYSMIRANRPNEFECPNPAGGGYSLLRKCNFREWLWGPKNKWPEPKVDKKRKVVTPALLVMCKCGVEAQDGLLPSGLGIGYWCGYMVDYDENLRKCKWEVFDHVEDRREYMVTLKYKQFMDQTMRSGTHFVDNYIKMRKRAQIDYARRLGVQTPSAAQWKKDCEAVKKKRAEEAALHAKIEVETIEYESIKGLEARLCLKIGCTGNWDVEVACSAYLGQTAVEAEKRANEREKMEEAEKRSAEAEMKDDDDTFRLDELIALAEADLKAEAFEKEKMKEAEKRSAEAEMEDDDDTSRLDELVALAEADLEAGKGKFLVNTLRTRSMMKSSSKPSMTSRPLTTRKRKKRPMQLSVAVPTSLWERIVVPKMKTCFPVMFWIIKSDLLYEFRLLAHRPSEPLCAHDL